MVKVLAFKSTSPGLNSRLRWWGHLIIARCFVVVRNLLEVVGLGLISSITEHKIIIAPQTKLNQIKPNPGVYGYKKWLVVTRKCLKSLV